MTQQRSFDDFPKPTFEAWKQVAIQSLKGGDFNKMLTSPTDEGITLQPIYTAEHIENLPFIHTLPAQFPYLRGTHDQPKAWRIAQTIAIQSPNEFNQALQHDLQNGQTAIVLRPDAPIIRTMDDLKVALDGIDLGKYPVICFGDTTLSQLLFTYSDELFGVISDDPFRHLSQDQALDVTQAASLTRQAIEQNRPLRTIGISTLIYHDAGATTVQESAYAIASGVTIIRELLKQGFTIDSIASHIAFEVGIGSNFLLEISKFRALRMLWANVVKAFGGNDQSAKIVVYAKTGITNKSQLDPHTNILRTATEGLSAVIAGVDGLDLSPFDHVICPPDEFSRRIARNQQLILQHEVNLAKLIDPSGGSYAIEYLTDQIARKAWEQFQSIEAQGGMVSVLQSGTIQSEIETITSARAARYAKRKDKLVGVNMYVNSGEPLPKVNLPSPDASHNLLKSHRYAEPFEALRYAVWDYAQRHGRKPTLHLANLGELRRHKPRTDFTLGFFGVGGFEFFNPDGDTNIEQIVQSITNANPDAVVICGADDDYQAIVPKLVPLLKAHDQTRPIILAGYPKDQIQAYQQAGVDEFIYLGADCLMLNNRLLRCFNDK